MTESWAEHLRRRVDQLGPATPEDELGAPIVVWLRHLPFRLREAIFLLLDGHERQQDRSAAKGVATRRARRGGAA